MRGYWIAYSYVGFMPDGSRRYFASPEDYKEAYQDAIADSD
jgi:hypothetical protein